MSFVFDQERYRLDTLTELERRIRLADLALQDAEVINADLDDQQIDVALENSHVKVRRAQQIVHLKVEGQRQLMRADE